MSRAARLRVFTFVTTVALLAGTSGGLRAQISTDLIEKNAGGFVGKGCVGDVRSRGTVDCATGRSSIGHTGTPVARSKT